jgi:hypothetical protein
MPYFPGPATKDVNSSLPSFQFPSQLPKQKPLSQIPSFKKIFPKREREGIRTKTGKLSTIPHQKTSTKGKKTTL